MSNDLGFRRTFRTFVVKFWKTLRSYFWAFLTTMTMGNGKKPGDMVEYGLQITNLASGLFIISALIGQIQDSIAAATQIKSEYRRRQMSSVQLIFWDKKVGRTPEKRLDGCFSYMNMNKVPGEIQHKVRLWFEFMMQELKVNTFWKFEKILQNFAEL